MNNDTIAVGSTATGSNAVKFNVTNDTSIVNNSDNGATLDTDNTTDVPHDVQNNNTTTSSIGNDSATVPLDTTRTTCDPHTIVNNPITASSFGHESGNEATEPMVIETIGVIPNHLSYSMNLWLSEGQKDQGKKEKEKEKKRAGRERNGEEEWGRTGERAEEEKTRGVEWRRGRRGRREERRGVKMFGRKGRRREQGKKRRL
ncbi:hypothetical protein BZA77DRAFT_389388 [Pyronema omphalodes]|nr:hypothetical protein BZA77DRAFT_389388 [Pyronema omphalodes]